jgi:hypothetical protein
MKTEEQIGNCPPDEVVPENREPAVKIRSKGFSGGVRITDVGIDGTAARWVPVTLGVAAPGPVG